MNESLEELNRAYVRAVQESDGAAAPRTSAGSRSPG